MKKLIVIVLGVLFLMSCGGESLSYKKIKALVASQSFVKERLKSPYSAKFNSSTKYVSVINDSTFFIDSSVDSENGFGAMVRSNYSCIIQYSGDMVYCKDLKIK